MHFAFTFRPAALGLCLVALVGSCGGKDDETDGAATTPDGDTTGGPGAMSCAELPEDLPVLRASIRPDEPAITIAIAEETNLECGGANVWIGTLRLPADVAPGVHTLSASPPSLYIRDYTIASCMGSETFAIEQFATGTVEITSVAADCVAGAIEAETVDGAGVLTRYGGSFAAAPP